eukprot:TRINITY_DN513_c0_g2_i7.p1 TRINITY_DN513_c0_g2~~TRINITY_DN513_c0_g2_i7.p1  ORF type:complete len:119 (+),score=12.29 TRINITY_DN513_c0_g2_i7:287-643(+)
MISRTSTFFSFPFSIIRDLGAPMMAPVAPVVAAPVVVGPNYLFQLHGSSLDRPSFHIHKWRVTEIRNLAPPSQTNQFASSSSFPFLSSSIGEISFCGWCCVSCICALCSDYHLLLCVP